MADSRGVSAVTRLRQSYFLLKSGCAVESPETTSLLLRNETVTWHERELSCITCHAHKAIPLPGYPRTNPSATSQSAFAMSTSAFAAPTKSSSLTDPTAPKVTEIPERYMRLEPKDPLIVIDDNPVFDAYAAGRILGRTDECLKKWRQRVQGPDYIQYERNGVVRYELSALMAFRAEHRVKPRTKV
jgi:hypothetical protein